MAALLVTYDLNKPGQDYLDFHKMIKTYAWLKLSESSYAIATGSTPGEIYDRLAPFIDKNDRVFVVSLGLYWKGLGDQQAYDWLRKYLLA